MKATKITGHAGHHCEGSAERSMSVCFGLLKSLWVLALLRCFLKRSAEGVQDLVDVGGKPAVLLAERGNLPDRVENGGVMLAAEILSDLRQ